MFGISFTELFVIAIVALLFIKPETLPEIAMTAGKVFVELKKLSSEFMNSFKDKK